MPSTSTAPFRPDEPHAHEHRHGTLVHTHVHIHPPGVPHDDPHAHDHAHDDGEHSAKAHGHVHEEGHSQSHGHHPRDQSHSHHHHGPGNHGHSHGLVDRSIIRSREGLKAVALSFGILAGAALVQLLVFVASGSVALLADLIHNAGDALTAIPLGIAFFLRSFRGEKLAGLAVVLAIFVSACVAGFEAVQRLIHPEQITHLWVLALAGVIGFVGNELAAQVRLRAGHRLQSPALIADGKHARADGYVSLSVVLTAVLVAVGLPRADPLIGLAITVVILKITLDSWRVISTTEPGELSHPHDRSVAGSRRSRAGQAPGSRTPKRSPGQTGTEGSRGDREAR